MATKKQRRMTPAEQSAAFIKTARELGGDERPEAFARTIKRIAPAKKPAKR